jgi:hypothetical protein
MATSRYSDYPGDMQQILDSRDPKKKQTSFDQTNTPPQYLPPAATPAAPSVNAGPVGRAAQQLPTAPARPMQSLADASPTAIGDGRTAIYASVGSKGEASFSNAPSSLDSLRTNFTAPNQAPEQRLSAMPGLAQIGGASQQPAGQYPTSLGDLSPGGRTPATAVTPTRAQSLSDALPGYLAAPAQTSPAVQQQANLAEAWRGGSSSGPDFAALGSSANMGDGIGTFSQANQGDAALAMGRFQKAADLRDGYKAKDQLQEAVAAQTRDRNFTVVRDSTQPVTRKEQAFNLSRALTTENLNDAVSGYQGAVAGQRQGVAADLQQRQAARLEDALAGANSPNATPEQKQRYQALLDPTGAGSQARQLTQAKIDETQANAAKLRNEANPTGGPMLTEGQSKDYNYYERGNAANGELSGNGAALTNAATGDRGQTRGVVDGLVRSIPGIGNSGVANTLVSKERQKAEQSGREFINAILRKDSGAALTDPEIAEYGRTYLPQPGDSNEVLQQKAIARTRALQGIRGGLGNVAGITSPVNQGASASTSRGVPSTGTVMQGHVFLGGDPASPSSWRKQ